MKEDYLWDRSGEADPEIERLEATLGSLRYRRPAQPLPLPATAAARFRPLFSPALAAAAALVIIVLAGALWLVPRGEGLHTVSGPGKPPGPIVVEGDRLARGTEPAPVRQKVAPAPARGSVQRLSAERRELMARLRNEARERESIRRGELAKEQLIKALHIASDKLSTVQKKIQGAQPGGPVS